MPPAKRKKQGQVHVLAAEKLAASELTLEEASRLGMEFLEPHQTAALGHEPLRSLKINYFDIDGKPAIDWPKHPPFYRLRYLEEPNGFDKLTEGKAQRYTQPIDTACCAYFPNSQPWPDLAQDVETALLITEGELKAASACKHGFNTIGLGGVYNWRSLPKGLEFLPELERINWVKRYVYVCFDNDYQTNPMVCAALAELAQALVERGAFVYVATFPVVEEGVKTGLDDYLLAYGPDSLREVLHLAKPLGMTQALFDFNKRYTYVHSPGLILAKDNMQKIAPGAFVDHKEAGARTYEQSLKVDGTISRRPVSAAKAWISWPQRDEVSALTYAPGKETRLGTEYNIWPGWGCEPKKGDIKPFMELLDHLFTGAEPEARAWFIKWCAYPIQFPGTKLFCSAVFHGVQQGTGKSLVGYTLKEIYGKNFTEISQADLHGGFNEWADGKQLVMGDDVTGSNKREDNDILKKLITQKEIRINTKYIPSYTVPDCLNYFFNSNHPDAFFLEDTDRRFFIHEVLVEPREQKFYTAYMKWLRSGGPEAIFYHFQHMDLRSFDPNARAFKTAARDRLIADVQSDLGAWVRRLRSLPEQVLKAGEIKLTKDLFTNKELLMLYDPLDRGKVTPNGLGRELKRAGIHQVLGGNLVQPAKGASERYYAVRNLGRWAKASHADCVAHLVEHEGMPEDGAKRKGAKF